MRNLLGFTPCLRFTLVQNASNAQKFTSLHTIFRFVYFTSAAGYMPGLLSWFLCVPETLRRDERSSSLYVTCVVPGHNLSNQRALCWEKQKHHSWMWWTWSKSKPRSSLVEARKRNFLIQKHDIRFDFFHCKCQIARAKLNSENKQRSSRSLHVM